MATQAMQRGFRLDAEIQALLPQREPDERERLKLLIRRDRYVDDLVVLDVQGGDRILGDGHGRLEIAEDEGLNYKIRLVPVKSRQEAVQWVVDNQLGRRNLTDEQRAYYRGKKYLNARQAGVVAPVPVFRLPDQSPPPDPADRTDARNIADQISEEAGVSIRTIFRDAEFAAALDEMEGQEKEEALAGEAGPRKEVVARVKGTKGILCERCKRVGAVKGCMDCLELRRDKRGKARTGSHRQPQSPKTKGSTNGAETFNWRDFSAQWGALFRQIDLLGHACKCKEGLKAQALREQLKSFKRDFVGLWESVTGEKAPREV